MRLQIQQPARIDLADIGEYLQIHESIPTAARVLRDFERTFELLCSQPLMGRQVEIIGEGARAISGVDWARSYRIYYTVEEDCVMILRVIHGRRDQGSALDEG